MKLFFIFLISILAFTKAERSFSIDYDGNTFLMDGQPFRYVSGSIHYFRIPRELWMDRLLKVRAAGLNAIQFVIQWNLHEPTPGNYNFEGNLDVEAFIEMAQEIGLHVLLRPGPYICAERDGGGLPFWLYQLHPDIKLRSSDPNYLSAVDRWWSVLLPKMQKLLYQNGGPILMVQLENEYGSYGLQTGNCDIVYMTHLRDLARRFLGNDVVLYTTDGNGDDYLRCGKTPEVYATVDFGPGSNVTAAFQTMRHFEPRGPLVNSEFYPGWLDYWGQPHNKVDANQSAKALDEILSTGANVNVYMIHGGTSFGLENGANTGGDSDPFSIEPTSYDYDSPISEAGDLTYKFEAFQRVISKYLPIPPIQVNSTSPKGSYGKVEMNFASTIFESKGMLLKSKQTNSTYPKSFESIGQDRGFVLYETQLVKMFTDPAQLSISLLHDRGYVFVNGEPRGILSRAEKVSSMPLSVLPGDRLQILVENQGRVGYGPNAKDFKGILSNVTLGGQVLTDWSIFGMPLNDGQAVEKYVKSMISLQNTNPDALKKILNGLKTSNGQSSFWHGEFQIPCDEEAAKDTFLSLPGWSKGVAFINGFNLGRYWPIMGPQQTLYVPAPKLKPPCQTNTLILLELESPGCSPNGKSCFVEFVSNHVIDGPTPASENLVHNTLPSSPRLVL